MDNCCKICGCNRFNKKIVSDTYSYRECKTCKLLVCDPLPTREVLKRYYNEIYDVDFYNYMNAIYPRRLIDVNYLLGNYSFNNVIEIGCSYGKTLLHLKLKGKETVGVEVSDKAREYGRGLGLEIFEDIGDVLDKYGKRRYDMLISWHVIEHMYTEEVIDVLSNCVSENGLIFLVTPNSRSLQKIVFEKYWEWATPPAHIYIFNQKNLRLLLEENNFKVVYQRTREGDAKSFFVNSGIALKRWLNETLLTNRNINYVVGNEICYRSRLRRVELLSWLLKPVDLVFLPFQHLESWTGFGSEIAILAKKIKV